MSRELKAFQAADDAWSDELRRVFGKKAGQARHDERGKGQKNTALRKLHEAREDARLAWYRSADFRQ